MTVTTQKAEKLRTIRD